MDKDLVEGRYKTCGYGHPVYDRDGHFEEVACGHDKSTGFCGEIVCPMDKNEVENKYGDR